MKKIIRFEGLYVVAVSWPGKTWVRAIRDTASHFTYATCFCFIASVQARVD